ncbi:hypothetical protein TWF481_012164 [Arthrobotrys musiformis]|uniref:Uncharacterized protein n=1 Tax=Arthrobotrys musiformis TaxID=47236 RepID=A0AAV9VXB8_9PEZI
MTNTLLADDGHAGRKFNKIKISGGILTILNAPVASKRPVNLQVIAEGLWANAIAYIDISSTERQDNGTFRQEEFESGMKIEYTACGL